ncbi:lysozyme [Orbaceae bacterium ESL0727]|nr:lysozyme [Orbaceae bacterium ESL0727]
MNISNNGKQLIKSFESLQLSAYHCPAGILTIGYGHTGNVKLGQTISEREADCLLMQDLYQAENSINKLVKVPLSQNQYDALVSFVFNVGTMAFNKSTLLCQLNNRDYVSAANEFLRWNKANGVVLAGLVKRRQAEKMLFERV